MRVNSHSSQQRSQKNLVVKVVNRPSPPPPRPVKQQQPVPLEETSWPLFKLDNKPNVKKFWDKKTSNDLDRVWFKRNEFAPFAGALLRIGRKKKSPKGYFYRIMSDGIIMYFKKESDSIPKGYLQLDITVRATIIQQKTKRNSIVPVILIERSQGIAITIFDHRIEQTMECFEVIKGFCLVRGFDHFYKQLDLLGKGSFASVFKVQKVDDDRIFAAKTYFKETFDANPQQDKFLLMVHNEVLTLRAVKHPGIVRLYEIIQDRDKLVLIMEYVPGGDLYQLIKRRKRLSEKVAATILKGVAEALLELHRFDYVHRDLKLENIMIEGKESFNVRIVDFGFAEKVNHLQLVSKAGTPGYIPPEIFKNHPYTTKGDIFSLGVIMYSLIAGDSPFKAPNYQVILEENKKSNIDFSKPLWNEISNECKLILKRMCEIRPESRITALDILESSWVLHHTKANSEMTYYQSYSQKPVSGLEYEKKPNSSSKSIRHDDEDKSFEFQADFSYHELKSFYKKASMKTIHSQKSNFSTVSNNHQKQNHVVKVIPRVQSETRQFHKQALKRKSKSIGFKKVDEVDSENSKPRVQTYVNQASFGERQSQSSNYEMAPDFVAVGYNNILFLRLAQQTFNQTKIPVASKGKVLYESPNQYTNEKESQNVVDKHSLFL